MSLRFLKQNLATSTPGGVQVNHSLRRGRPFVVLDEGVGSEEASLFTPVEEENEAVLEGLFVRGQDPESLQHDGDHRCGIPSPRTHDRGVVVGVDQQTRGWVVHATPSETGDNILNSLVIV